MHLPLRGSAVAALLCLPLLVTACAELEQYREEIELAKEILRRIRGVEPAPPAPAPPAVISPEAPALSVKGKCVGRDETGYAENVQLEVVGGQVRQFDARIDVPKRGSCRFQLAEFAQSKQTPYVELAARSRTACAIRMWQQAERVTVTATDCEEKCARGAFEYIWPIQLDARTGGCY
jgi:hypothetical protein